MTIYAVEHQGDYCTIQFGCSTKREVAEKKQKEYEGFGLSCWVEEYTLDENE